MRDAGIKVNERLTTSVPGIHALGACAALPGSIHTASIDAQAEALSATLHGTPTRPDPRPLPLRLNTPACAMVLMDPPRIHGEWHEKANRGGVTSLFHDRRGQLRGFVLEGSAVDASGPLARKAHGLLNPLPRRPTAYLAPMLASEPGTGLGEVM